MTSERQPAFAGRRVQGIHWCHVALGSAGRRPAGRGRFRRAAAFGASTAAARKSASRRSSARSFYEGYDAPDYVWQTTGGEDFEPKFSLVPLMFGTLKGTFYAMLFAVPLAACSGRRMPATSPRRPCGRRSSRWSRSWPPCPRW